MYGLKFEEQYLLTMQYSKVIVRVSEPDVSESKLWRYAVMVHIFWGVMQVDS